MVLKSGSHQRHLGRGSGSGGLARTQALVVLKKVVDQVRENEKYRACRGHPAGATWCSPEGRRRGLPASVPPPVGWAWDAATRTLWTEPGVSRGHRCPARGGVRRQGGLRRLSLAIAGRSESPPGSVRSRRNGACDGWRSSNWNPPEPRLRRGPAATLHGAPQEGGTMASKARLPPLFRGWTGFPR